MTFTIGRASFAGAPYDLRHDGDRLSFRIDIDTESASTVAEAKVLRQQVLGLVDNDDEPVIPLTWDDDPDLDGFYRVLRAEVAPFPVFLANGFAPCSLDLERVGGGYALPDIEVPFVAANRDTSFAAPTPSTRVYIPASAIYRGASVTLSSTRTTADGTLDAASAASASGVPSYRIEASNFYDSSVVVERYVNGSWYAVVGNAIPPTTPDALRISNGLVRFTWDTDEIVGEVYDSSLWVEFGRFHHWFGNPARTEQVPVGSPNITRNSPNVATVQQQTEQAILYKCVTSISLRRGDLFGSFSSTGFNADGKWGIYASSVTAATSITGGIHSTANDANGNRWILASELNVTKDTTNGRLASNYVATDDSFMIGVELGGSGASGEFTAASVVAGYWRAVSESQRVVSR